MSAARSPAAEEQRLATLPAFVTEKAWHLRSRADRLHAALADTTDRHLERRTARMRVEHEVRRLEADSRHLRPRLFNAADEERAEGPLREARMRLARLQTEEARLAAEREALAPKWQAAARLADAADVLVRSGGAPTAPLVATTARARKAEPVAGLVTVRAELAALDAEQRALSAAPKPVDEVLRAVDALVDELAARWDPPVNALFRAGTAAPSTALFVPAWDDRDRPYFDAWLHGDALKARLRATVLAAPEAQAAAVPTIQRARHVVALVAKRRGLEMEEETFAARAEMAGHDVDRRPDADAALVLAVVMDPSA
jgi:hypothetical protein